jgi:GNAT superfamily N-acetyltransferase
VAVGCYEPTADPGTVEVAFVVEDRWQGQGVGTALFRELLRVAESRGIRRCRAYVLADNTRMVDLITRFTTVHTRSLDQGVLTLEFTPRPACGA